MTALRTYDDVMQFLLEFVDYEKVAKYKYDIATFNLRRVEDLMAAMGDPHCAFRSVHIAGTKGKGSTAIMVQSILTAAGFRTGLFTSPHLCRLEERMTVDGRMMSEEDLVRTIGALVAYTEQARRERPNESPSFFELVTALGFLHFAAQKAEFAVVEVGMGGRLDATNVIRPEVSAITRVDLDHVERLGSTLAKIAWEKAGIIKPGVPLVCAPQEPDALAVIRQTAAERGAPLALVGHDYTLEHVETGVGPDGPFCRFDVTGPCCRYEALTVSLLGRHQAANAAVAVAVVEHLREKCGLDLNEEKIRLGLAAARCPARLEYLSGSPPILLDAAHNPASIRVLQEVLGGAFEHRRVVLLMGVSKDKDVPEMLRAILPRAARVIFTRSDSPRAEEPALLAEHARELCGIEAEVFDDAHLALARARELAGTEDLICVTGSFYLAGKLWPLLREAAAGVG